MIYLDNAATARPLTVALEAYREAPFGNPSSGHLYGQRAREALEEARVTVAECIGARPEEIVFTSGATEAAKTAIYSAEMNRKLVVCDPCEHHAVSENVSKSKRTGRPVLAMMLVNNETGVIEEAADYICDATSALGHIPVDVRKLGCSFLFGGAHKFGGVPGAGLLYVRTGVKAHPLFRGGGQERGMRAGTENVPAICAMAAALKWQTENMERNTLHVMRLKAEMLNRLKGTEYLVNAVGETSPYILNLSFPGTENGALVLMLSNRGVMVSAGAACTTGDNAPSHVLMAMYGDEARARSAIRISFAHDTTEDEVRIAASEIVDTVALLRGMGT